MAVIDQRRGVFVEKSFFWPIDRYVYLIYVFSLWVKLQEEGSQKSGRSVLADMLKGTLTSET